jgi:hypothetical protein
MLYQCSQDCIEPAENGGKEQLKPALKPAQAAKPPTVA